MRRIGAIVLALVLALGLGVPAMAAEGDQGIDTGMLTPGEDAPVIAEAEDAAAESEGGEDGMDAALTELTLKVKETLQIDAGYTDFTSDYYDGVTPYWALTWSDSDRQLSVEARPDGTVLSAYLWDGSYSGDRFYGFDPAFPPLTRTDAEREFQQWSERLFTGPETARVDSVRTYLGADGYYRFSGTVEENGLPSPVTFAMSVGGAGLTSFSRSDSYGGYVGQLPDPEPAADEDAGAEGLAGAVQLELLYVSDGEGGAQLRYVPVGPYTVVDAQSGEAVDMDALYASLGGMASVNGIYAKGAEPADAMAMAEDTGLTEAEITSIANYGDVLDEAGMDEMLRDIPALGLETFQLQWCSYAMEGEDGVTATLRYSAPMTAEQLYGYTQESLEAAQAVGTDTTIWKTVTADARTGELKSLYTVYPVLDEDTDVTMTQAVLTRAAENFLKQAAPERLKETEVCTLKGYDQEGTVTYVQVHEGYLYPDNHLSVTVNRASGTVDAYETAWEDVEFGPAAEPVTAKEAKDAYCGALEPELGYVAWPLDVTAEENSIYAPLADIGYTYVEGLRLGYYYANRDLVEGVDALTGEPVVTPAAEDEGVYVYEDLEDVPQAPEIEALGQAGVGFAGGAFLPEEKITQREAVCLLLQAAGGTGGWDLSNEDLLDQALWQGFLPGEVWDPAGPVTRMEFIRMMVRPSRYGDAADLLSLEDSEGYELVALALDMDTADPEAEITRAEAAELLYRFMDR